MSDRVVLKKALLFHWLLKPTFELKAFWLLLALIISGCATTMKHDGKLTEAAKNQRWQTLQKQLLALENWQLNARLKLKLPDKSAFLSLTWEQSATAYELYLHATFGQLVSHIQGNDNQITATVAGQKEVITGSSPERIMRHITGWDIPVSSLKYWIRGLPMPDTKAELALNDHGQLAQLTQQGWQITYKTYRDTNGIPLPERIIISDNQVSLTLFIKQWQFDI